MCDRIVSVSVYTSRCAYLFYAETCVSVSRKAHTYTCVRDVSVPVCTYLNVPYTNLWEGLFLFWSAHCHGRAAFVNESGRLEWCMYVRIHVHIWTCVYVYMHMRICVCVCMRVQMSISPIPWWEFWQECALGDNTVKACIHVQFDEPIIWDIGPSSDFARGCHGNRFCIILLLFQKYSMKPFTSDTILIVLVSSEREWNLTPDYTE